MRIQHTLSLIAAATLSLSALAAPPAAGTEAGDSAMPSVHVVGGASYKLRPIEFEGVQGAYALADGRTLHVSGARHKLYADLGQAKFEIVPVAQNVFASRDDALRLAFDQIPFATEVTLSSTDK
jgi:hypothetical protein